MQHWVSTAVNATGPTPTLHPWVVFFLAAKSSGNKFDKIDPKSVHFTTLVRWAIGILLAFSRKWKNLQQHEATKWRGKSPVIRPYVWKGPQRCMIWTAAVTLTSHNLNRWCLESCSRMYQNTINNEIKYQFWWVSQKGPPSTVSTVWLGESLCSQAYLPWPMPASQKKIVSPEGASWLSRYLRWSSFPPHCQRWRSACQPQSQDRWESTREPRGNWIHPSGYGIIFDGHSKLLSWKRSWVWSPTFWNVRNGNSHLGKSTSPRYIKLNLEISQPFLQWPDLQRHAKCWNGLAQNGYIYVYICSAALLRNYITNKHIK